MLRLPPLLDDRLKDEGARHRPRRPTVTSSSFDLGAPVVVHRSVEASHQLTVYVHRLESTQVGTLTVYGGASSPDASATVFTRYAEAAVTGIPVPGYSVEAFGATALMRPCAAPGRAASPLLSSGTASMEVLPGEAPEEALRRVWGAKDAASAQSLAEADPEEIEALAALRTMAGLDPLARSIPAAPVVRDAPLPPAPSAPAESPAEDPHAVFDRMGAAASMAETFDVGTVPLSRRFDEMDCILDDERAPTPGDTPRAAPVPASTRSGATGPGPEAAIREAAASVLDDFSLIQDIVALRDAVPAPTVASPSAPTPGTPVAPGGAPPATALPPAGIGTVEPTAAADPSRPIAVASMRLGDLIGAPGWPLAMYLGGGRVVEASTCGLTISVLDLSRRTLVLRQRDLTGERAAVLRRQVTDQLDEDGSALGTVTAPRFVVAGAVPATAGGRGLVNLGLVPDALQIPRLIVQMYAEAEAPVTSAPVEWRAGAAPTAIVLSDAVEYLGQVGG